MKKNQKGSALLWALIVVGVLSILIAASLTIAFAYKHRAVVNNDKRQAYLTAKGFIEDIVDNVTGSNEEYLALFTDTSKDSYTPLVEVEQSIPLAISLPNDYEMGSISDAYIKINEVKEEEKLMKSLGSITVSVQATYANQAYRVFADLWLGYTVKDGFKWQIIKYYQRDEGIIYSNNVTKASELLIEFTHIYNIFIENGGKNESVKFIIEYMKNDPTWKNIPEDIKIKLEGMRYFNDIDIRHFFSYRNENNTFQEFNKDEIKKSILKVPVAVTENGVVKIITKDVDLSKNGFYNNKYYIQPKYSKNNAKFSFIFANLSATPNNGGKINLFYSDGSWYYVEEIFLEGMSAPALLVPPSLDASNSDEIWENFKKTYLTEGNKIQ